MKKIILILFIILLGIIWLVNKNRICLESHKELIAGRGKYPYFKQITFCDRWSK